MLSGLTAFIFKKSISIGRLYIIMILKRTLLSLYLGFILFSVLNFFWGNSGLFSFRAIEKSKQGLEENLQSLEEINERHNHELDVLRKNPEIIRLYARELGYYKEGETVVKLEGYSPKKQSYEVGKIIKVEFKSRDNRFLLQVIGFSFSVFLILSGAATQIHGRKTSPVPKIDGSIS